MARNFDDAPAKLGGFGKLSIVASGVKVTPEIDGFDPFGQEAVHGRSIVFD